jgi:hypothetical protein
MLPVRYQQALRDMKMTPFSDETILPPPIWQTDSDYLNISRPVENYTHYGSADVRFTVTTQTLWGGKSAFRTTQDQVDRYVDGVAIGDSFTFCFTEPEDCWVQKLAALTNRNVINMGIVGTGSTSHQRILRDYGMPLTPPLVIWQWYGNDPNEDFGLARLRGETDVQSPIQTPEVTWEMNWFRQNSALYVLLDMYLSPREKYDAFMWTVPQECASEGEINLCFGQPYLWDAMDSSLIHNDYGWQRSREALMESQQMVNTYDGTLLVILIPTREQVYREMAEPLIGTEKLAILDQNHQRMLDLCAELDLQCLDFLPVFRAHAEQGEQLYYRLDLHINPHGNEIVAEAIRDWLVEHAVFGG